MKRALPLFLFLAFIAIYNNSYADRRYFARSYLSNTLPAKALEFELWNTGRFDKGQGYYFRYQPRFEFEYGVTDNLSASFYFNFNQVKSTMTDFKPEPLGFESNSLELKYRFTDPGQTFIDPALYFEFAYGGEEIGYESKVILSRRFSSFVTAFNLTSEIERNVIESQNESSLELTGGLAYEITPAFSLGLEFRHDRNYESIYETGTNQATLLGPTINIQTEAFYLTLNVMQQLSGSQSNSSGNLDLTGHEKYEFRTILGISL